jgi:hypothetical protein
MPTWLPDGPTPPARGGRAERARSALARRCERQVDASADEGAAGAAEGAAEALPEALSYPPSARTGGDVVKVDAPAPGEVRGR